VSKPIPGPADADDQRFIDPLVVTIRELWRRRQSWHRAEKSLTLAMTAICRRYVGVRGKGDTENLEKAKELLERIEEGEDTSDAAMAALPLLAARSQIEPHRLSVERALEGYARQLPIAHVMAETRGFACLGLAGIVGEAGAIGEYRTVSGLWKRLGLSVIDGKAQGRRSDAIEAKRHGFAPARRAAIWNIGNQLIGAMGRGPRPLVGEDVDAREDLSRWQVMFVKRLRYEADRDPKHRRPDKDKNGQMIESFSKHAAARAKRYVEKQFLKYLWQQWRENATHLASDAQNMIGRARRRPNVAARPTGAPAGATNLNDTTHRCSDIQSLPGRVRRRPTRGTISRKVSAGATNSTNNAAHSIDDSHHADGRVRRRPSRGAKTTRPSAGATNSRESATQVNPDTHLRGGRARRRPSLPAKSKLPPAGATSLTTER